MRLVCSLLSLIVAGVLPALAGEAGVKATPPPAGARSAKAPGKELAVEKRPDVARALLDAGDNRVELEAALRAAPARQREAMAFLIANMPERDLGTLHRNYLLENVALAFQARAAAPWGKKLPEEIFLNDVLPYANINERRDDWRKDFRTRFAPLVKACKTPGDAAMCLNKEIFPLLKVQYHATKRPKPDQSPYESIEAGYASCTGLSILLVDACRAVGVPARLAGTPAWTTTRGNHTWVEIWNGEWHFLGAAEPGPLDRTWFVENASHADASTPEHRIYAASWRKTGTPFLLVWDPSIRYVSAVDVTARYAAKAGAGG